jgi:Holliday junction resolvasome RuvABC endonuclease subunit
MTILALDLGTKLGWAVSFGKGPDGKLDVLHGTTEFRVGRHESAGHRWIRFRTWLGQIAEGHGPLECVYYEEVRAHKGVDAAHMYGGFLANLQAWCVKKGIEYCGIPVGQIKKSWTGKGNANKAAMIAEAQKRGFSPETDNDADALALLLCVQAEREAA